MHSTRSRSAALLLVALAHVGACAGHAPGAQEAEAMTKQLSVEASVAAVLDDFHAAASAADGDRYFAHFAPDGVFVGTDATERWSVDAFRDYAAPYFAQGKGWTYVPTARHVRIGPHGDTAWFHEQLQNESYGATRGSGVLRRMNGAWRIEQYVLSFPVPNDLAKDVIELIRGSADEAR